MQSCGKKKYSLCHATFAKTLRDRTLSLIRSHNMRGTQLRITSNFLSVIASIA